MNCKEIEQNLIDIADHNLDNIHNAEVREHLEICDMCRNSVAQYEALFSVIANQKMQVPDKIISENFHKMLEQEKLINLPSGSINRKKTKTLWKPLLKVSSLALLMIFSYLFGAFSNENSLSKKHASNIKNSSDINFISSLMQLENESASSRLQAVNFMEELENPEEEILDALIRKMNNDKHLNIRLAAANALNKFSSNELVKKALILQLEVEENVNMQLELIQILVQIQEKRAIPSIQKLLISEKTPHYVKEQIGTELKYLI